MKKLYMIWFTCLIGLLITACYDDNGNYDYRKIGEVQIDGLEETYECVAYQDVLHVEPKVTITDGSSDLEYFWTLNLTPGSSTMSEKIKIELDTIGRERVLDYPITEKAGAYDLTLWAKNKANGATSIETVSLSVVTPFSEGFYLLKEINGGTDLDLHLKDGSYVMDILEAKDGQPMPGAPVSIGLDPTYSFINAQTEYEITKAVTICTENDVRISNIEDMSVIYTYNTMFLGEIPTGEKPYYIWRNYFGVGYTCDKGIYFSYQAPSYQLLGTGKFGLPVLVNDSEGTKPSFYGVISSGCWFFFDELKGRLLYLDFNGSLHTFKDEDEEGKKQPYPINGIPHKLKYFGINYIAADKETNGYILFEDENNVDKLYIYHMVLSTTNIYNPIKKVIEVGASSKLHEADLFATYESTAKVMYFVANNQIYLYDLEQQVEEPLNPTGMAAGEEITYIKNYYWKEDAVTGDNFDYLVFATHQNGKYKVYMYNILGGKPNGGPVRILEGDGKVVSMRFVDKDMKIDSTIPAL